MPTEIAIPPPAAKITPRAASPTESLGAPESPAKTTTAENIKAAKRPKKAMRSERESRTPPSVEK